MDEQYSRGELLRRGYLAALPALERNLQWRILLLLRERVGG
jgi:hypothetical protein